VLISDGCGTHESLEMMTHCSTVDCGTAVQLHDIFTAVISARQLPRTPR
jgi:hypothetical protein